MPRISVILPVLNGRESLPRAIKSIQAQSVPDWELLVINEFASKDGSGELVCRMAEKDPRIRLVQNQERLGLAESLNVGIRLAEGEFIARIDADDISMPTRLEKQLELFATQPSVAICGTWQRHVGRKGSSVHRPPTDSAELAASLLFTCELCHSTVMMRRETLLENQLFYDARFQAEDYELWTRAINATQIANIPEILGEYHVGDTITAGKQGALEEEHGQICAAAMERTLGLTLDLSAWPLMNAWQNIFWHERDGARRREMLAAYETILRAVYSANASAGVFPETAILSVLRRRWLWAKWDLQSTPVDSARTQRLEDVFAPVSFSHLRWVAQKLGRKFFRSQVI